MFGAAYIALVCLMPQFLVVMWNVPFYLGGTSLLIVVVVVMDFMAQVQSHLMSHQYDSVHEKGEFEELWWAGRVRQRVGPPGGVKLYESTCIGKENVPKLQDRSPQGRRARDLQDRSAPQAAPG